MVDPLSEVISLLQPGTVFSKGISAAGRWGVRYTQFGHPSFCAVLEGSCRLAVDGHELLTLEAGDFVLMPATPGFTMSGFEPVRPKKMDPNVSASLTGELRHGTHDGPPDVRLLGGYFIFGSPDAALIVSLLPQLVHVRGERRLATMVQLVGEESREQRSGRDLVLTRLAEVLLIEALRSVTGSTSSPGLLRGLADLRLAAAIRQMHENPARSWTVEQLAKESALSRSAFFDRFNRAVGVPRWSTCMRGAWHWPRTCCGEVMSDWRRSLNASATALQAPSAPHSVATSVSRRPVCPKSLIRLITRTSADGEPNERNQEAQRPRTREKQVTRYLSYPMQILPTSTGTTSR